MHRDELIEELTTDILGYVMHGAFPEEHVVGEIKPAGLDHRFDEYEMLVRLHFILKPEVVEFVQALPKRVRQIKTQTENVSHRGRGQVKGRINWNKTIRERNARAPGDSSIFVFDDRSESYDIDENVVLKQLISIIYHTLDDCREYLDREYEWVTDSWQENLALVDRLENIFERNVHVTRISPPKEYEPTSRMLESAAEARSPLYREAATLLSEYRTLLDADEESLRELLESTAITPSDDETLLELFVLFKYISAIEDLFNGEFNLRTIESGKQEVARLDANHSDLEIVVYHDSSARNHDVTFTQEPTGQPTDFSRHEMVEHASLETAKNYFKDPELESWTGRPDVIVIEARHGGRRDYHITEVKNSTERPTVRSGITETLEYLAFFQEKISEEDTEYVFGDETAYLGSGWNGTLVIQDIETETASLQEQRSQRIKILQASEVEERLPEILENVL
jgi:hypothetical protein